ncbi:hypothetical protein F4804DRAFT_331736 [Jackrogersella minutella]|nr:hypothetical protein F4804DRAFT_331736 [Jackrogersella minutella]
MASKATYIPRYLLPRYGAVWRTTTRSTVITRPLSPELNRILVRYASKTAAPKPTKTKTPKAAAAKVEAPKAVSTKPVITTTTPPPHHKSPASKALKHSAPTKPPVKHPSTKPIAAQAATPKTPATPAPAPAPASTPKPTSKPAPAAPTPKPIVKNSAPAPAAKPAVTPKPAAASKPSDPSKPIVLEKPEKFNPPSHGARLPRSTPKHYGGPMSEAELQAQTVKTYPGLPPPENTWSHWIIHSRGIHLFITLGTLTSLAVYTFVTNFKAKSPFADMIPPISEFPSHPFQYVGVLIDIMRMQQEHESAQTAEMRRKKVDDVAKRNEYRKAHGLEPASGLFGTTSVSQPKPEPQTAEGETTPAVDPPLSDAFTPDGKRKKFFGIF